MRFGLVILLFFGLVSVSFAQDVYRFGLLPVFNTNVKLKNDFSLNAKLENRHIFNRGVFNSELRNSEYRFERQDVAAVLAKKLSANIELGGGYLFRVESERIIHRLTQQTSITQPFGRIRIAHRIRTDQTWDPDETFEFRIRYRFGLQYPLFGEKLDPNELYLKSNFEYLARFQDDFTNEVRWVPALGYFGKDKNSFELGLDYRVGALVQNVREHGFWIYLGYYLRFNN